MTLPILQVLLAAFLLALYGHAHPPVEDGAAPASFHPVLSPLLVLGLSLSPFFLGRLLVERLRGQLARREPDVRRFVRDLLRTAGFVRLSVTASYAAALFLGHWPRSVEALVEGLGLGSWPLLDEALAFAPFVIALAASLDPTYHLQAIPHPRAWTRRDFVAFQLRLTALVMAPLALVILLFDLRDASETVKRWMAIFDYLNVAAMVLVLALLFLLAPVLLRWVLGARRLPDGPLRASLEAFARRIGFGYRDLLILRTSGNVVNAAIIGIVPALRYVIFTDGLVTHLTSEEIHAVFAHEVGHAKRFHLSIYLIFALTCVFLFLVMVRFVFPLAPALLGEDRPLGWLLMILFFGFYWGLGFGFLSRRLERDADAFGARAVGSVPLFVAALERIARLAGNVRRRRTWRHFSIERRVAFLQEADARPESLRAASRALRGCLAVLVVLFVGSLFLVTRDVRAQHQVRLARLAIERRDLESAEAHLREAIDRAPKDPFYRYYLGETYLLAHRFEEARAAWLLALDLDPPEELASAIRKYLEQLAKLDPASRSSEAAGERASPER